LPTVAKIPSFPSIALHCFALVRDSKKLNKPFIYAFLVAFEVVAGGGIEPPTQGFSVNFWRPA
jgi:hypothetical protein